MKKLAVFIPGIGYTADKPLLYYSAKLILSAGFDNFPLHFGGFPSNVRGSADKMKESFLTAWEQTQRQMRDVDFGAYGRILFVSKSIGTVIAARYQLENRIAADNIYFTPLEETFRFMRRGSGIAFHGSADPWTEGVSIDDLCSQYNIPVCNVPGANHSLETGDICRDILTLGRVMDIVQNRISSL